jgi:phosphoglycolate phosphatase
VRKGVATARRNGQVSPMRGILFDKDGTLLDFEATWTPILTRLALEVAGGDQTRATALLDAGGLDPATGRFRAGSAIGAGTTRTIAGLWHPAVAPAERARRVAAMDRAFHDHGARNSVALPGVAEALAALAVEGYVLGVVTNDTTAAARVALAGTGLLPHFARVIGYDAVTHAKPAPDMVLAFATTENIAPAEIAVVGDNLHDLEMARAAGAGLVVGVTSGNSSAADLAPHADVVLASVADLPVYLRQTGQNRQNGQNKK